MVAQDWSIEEKIDFLGNEDKEKTTYYVGVLYEPFWNIIFRRRQWFNFNVNMYVSIAPSF